VGGPAPDVVHDIPQRVSIDQLHGEVDLAGGVGADLVHRHDVRMFQRAGDLRLGDEALHRGPVLSVRLRGPQVGLLQNLHGDVALQVGIDGAVDHRHAAFADLPLHAVTRMGATGDLPHGVGVAPGQG